MLLKVNNWILCRLVLMVVGWITMQEAEAQTQLEGSALFGRKYQIGESYRYRLTMVEQENGKWSSTMVSICVLKVVMDSAGIPFDEIRWISQKTLTPKDTVDNSADAVSVEPYRISLDPRGSLAIPLIKVPSMTEPVTDFNTFFVAIAPQVGATGLEKKGDSLLKTSPVKGDFSNGKNILKGEDCLQVSVYMTDQTNRTVSLHSAFLPPKQSCLSYLIPEMNIPVIKDTMNNFQMLMPGENNSFIIQYGR